MKNEKVWKIAMTGVFAALSYVVFTFLQFKIWLPGGDATSIHFGNAVCVLGALILGGVYGGIGGAIGMTIGDLLDPVYVVYAPKTFILNFCMSWFIQTCNRHTNGRRNCPAAISISISISIDNKYHLYYYI